MSAQPTTTRKTSQAALSEACDNFYWFIDYITGGTREESLRQAPQGILGLEKKAAIVAALASNPNKVSAANTWLMERAGRVHSRVETYRARYCGPDATAAAEVARRERQNAICGTACMQKETLARYACCELATPAQCVCHYSTDCPTHGRRCNGSHD
jgi:hypothetical protein